MRIGILTLPQETNYGGILQAFALQKVLRDMGHEALTIDRHQRRQYDSFSKHIGGYLKRLYHHYVFKKNVSPRWNPFLTENEYRTISQNTQRFIDANIAMTRRAFSDQLFEIDKEYSFDAYVVGSDQVWLDYYCPNSFLDFVKRDNVIKIVYAASCGPQSFFCNDNKLALCKELAKTFVGVSVREQSLVDLCKESLGVDAKWVLDPTMLLRQEDYIGRIGQPLDQESPILFSYILDESNSKDAILSSIAKAKNLEVVHGGTTKKYIKGITKSINDCVYPSVEDWLYKIASSSFVVTDSFHGTVFSILFNRPFITICNSHRGSNRFFSLLSLFGLESRLIKESDSVNIEKIIGESIDYTKVNTILEGERKKSMTFLTKCLNGTR